MGIKDIEEFYILLQTELDANENLKEVKNDEDLLTYLKSGR